jgi:hypothetical protein
MTPNMEKRLLELIDNPPPGSAIAEAKEFGADLYNVIENLKLTPGERLRRAAQETDLVRRIREGGRGTGS